MKPMRLFLSLCFAIAIALALQARPAVAEFNKVFGVTLTPEQQEKFKAIHAEAEPAKKAIRENATLSETQKHEQMKAVYDGIKAKLKAILTPEQVKDMEAFEAAQAQKPPSSASKPGKVFGVTLTPEQQEKFKAIHAEAEPAKKAIRDNAALSEAQKREQMKAVYDGIKAKLKAILTPEQVKEMEAAEAAKR